MNDRHPSGDSHPSAPDAGHASYGSYDQQSLHYGDGYPAYGYDGYDAYGTGSVAPASTAFPPDSGYPASHTATTAYPADGFATGSFTPGAFAGANDYDSDPLFGDLPGTAPGAAAGYDMTGQWDTTGAYAPPTADPYGTQSQAQPHGAYDTGGYPTGTTGGYPDAGYDLTGQWDATAWAGTDQTDTGLWDTTSYAQQVPEQVPPQYDGYAPQDFAGLTADPAEAADAAASYAPTGYDTTGHETTGHETAGYETTGYETLGYETTGHDTAGYETPAHESGGHDAHGYDPNALDTHAYGYAPHGYESSPYGGLEPELADYERELADIDATGFDTGTDHAAYADATDPYAGPTPHDHASPAPGTVDDEPAGMHEDGYREYDDAGYQDEAEDQGQDEADDGYRDGDGRDEGRELAPVSRRAPGRGSGSRRRSPAKRSALLTVAVPSVCVIGVAGVAAASVGGLGGDDKPATAASDIKPAEANNKLDTQLDNLSADTRDFADRASRTQERIDLKAQEEAKRKKAAEDAARKERLRPKFVLPVTQKGLSATFGQAGVNWMSVHTGIDFPVAYGTQVMAATDGTVRFQYNTAYGNMAILTAKDGTETWYCHLSSYRVNSGTTVKAGDVIAFSGSSGNSTGPHLHFEVRPGGGDAIDPLPWLRSHGLDPT